jgi:hypothetical protein
MGASVADLLARLFHREEADCDSIDQAETEAGYRLTVNGERRNVLRDCEQ